MIGSYHNGCYRNLLSEYEVSVVQRARPRSSFPLQFVD